MTLCYDAVKYQCNRKILLYIIFFFSAIYTPQPLYNTVRYNTVLDITRISFGPQLVIFDLISYITIHFTLFITQFG